MGWVTFAVGLFAAACNSGPGAPAADRLSRALNGAESGETVQLGAGSVTGSFEIPAGVVVEGSEDGQTTVVAPDGDPGLVLQPGPEGQPTTVRNVTVISQGGFGVVARGDGRVALTDVNVEAHTGVGIGLENLAAATLERVHAQGPVTAENPSAPAEPTPDNSATHGIVLLRVADAQLTDVTSNGFTLFGALLLGSDTSWQGGGASENMGTGLMVEGGSADLEALRLCDEFQGVRLLPAFGGVFSGGADVTSSALQTCNVEGLGLFHAGATGLHTDLAATGNNDAAVWIQDTEQFEIRGMGTMLAENGLGGVVAVDSSGLVVQDAEIRSTQLQPRVLSEAGLIEVGDGIQLVGTTNDVMLDNLLLENNERVGMLLDLAGSSTSQVAIGDVTVDGEGDQLGAIAQDGDVGPAWDEGIMRLGATATNDPEFSGTLDVVKAVSPTDYPTASDVADSGIDIFGAVSPTD
jgi:hypothetical protein